MNKGKRTPHQLQADTIAAFQDLLFVSTRIKGLLAEMREHGIEFKLNVHTEALIRKVTQVSEEPLLEVGAARLIALEDDTWPEKLMDHILNGAKKRGGTP